MGVVRYKVGDKLMWKSSYIKSKRNNSICKIIDISSRMVTVQEIGSNEKFFWGEYELNDFYVKFKTIVNYPKEVV